MAADVLPVSESDIPQVSRSLARAFRDDPVFTHLLGGKELSEEKGSTFFGVFANIQLEHGHVYRTAGNEGAAIWAPPGKWKVPNSAIAKSVPKMLRVFSWRLIPNLALLSRLEKAHPDEPHYYLEFIGTDPAHQGKGVGTALMTPMVERCDTEGVGAYLESSKESNVPFYRRFGFEVRQEIEHPKGPKQWLMWRDPR